MTRKTYAYVKTWGALYSVLIFVFLFSSQLIEFYNHTDELKKVVTFFVVIVSIILFFAKLMAIGYMTNFEDGANKQVVFKFNLNFYEKFMEHQKRKQKTKEANIKLTENKQKLLLELSESNDDKKSEILIDKITLIETSLK